jgi:ankyrin repeat protein
MRLRLAFAAVLLVSACAQRTPPSPMHVVTLPSGKQIRAFEPSTAKFADDSAYYRFSYLTSLPLDMPISPSQRPAIAAEADEIWGVIRPDVEKTGFTLAEIGSQTSFGTKVPTYLPFFGPTVTTFAHGSSFWFKRARDGTWARLAGVPPLPQIGRSEIQAAAEQGDVQAVEYQFAHGASHTLVPGDMTRALSAAEARGHNDVVRVLLLNVSVPDAYSMGGMGIQNDLDGLNQIFRHDELAHDVPGPSKNAALRGLLVGDGYKQSEERAQMVEWLLSHGANANDKTDKSGPITPVMLAHTPEMLELLITHGANLDVVGPSGGLAAQFACDPQLQDPVAMLKVLKSHGVDVTATAAGSLRSPMQCAGAASPGRPEVEAYLVAQGAKAPARPQ